jgi:hypothetical protein
MKVQIEKMRMWRQRRRQRRLERAHLRALMGNAGRPSVHSAHVRPDGGAMLFGALGSGPMDGGSGS